MNRSYTAKMNYRVVELGHEDYNEVLNINRSVYSGLDYLPTAYHELLHDKNNRMFGGRRTCDNILVSKS